MSLIARLQQDPQPIYEIGSVVATNYLITPHADASQWVRVNNVYSDPVALVDDDGEPFLRFTRGALGAAGVYIDPSALTLAGGSYDLHLWIRSSAAETSAALSMRVGTVSGSDVTGDTFSTTSTWTEYTQNVTVTGKPNWTLMLATGAGTVDSNIDVKLGAIMPAGIDPFYGDDTSDRGEGYEFYWEGEINASRSLKAPRTLTNTPGLLRAVEDLSSLSVTEDATPLSPDDSSGGAMQVKFGVTDYPDSLDLNGATVEIVDDVADQALVIGKESSLGGDSSVASLTSLSVLSRLNVVKTVDPFHGQMGDYLTNYLAKAGIVTPLNIGVGISTREVSIAGFNGNLWAKFKELCAVHGIEVSDLGDGVYFRQPRTRTLDVENIAGQNWSLAAQSPAQSIEVYNYNSGYFEDALIYPPAVYDDTSGSTSKAGWTPQSEILTVDAGSITTVEVPIAGSLMSVEQPTCVTDVGPTDGADGSVYTVIGQGTDDGSGSVQTLDPDEWARRGGSVSVKVGDNFDTIIITIRSGHNEASLAPFAIAMQSGDSTYYSSLRIRGTGILNRKTKHTYPTGLGPEDTTTESGATIDSPFITSRELCDRVAYETRVRYGGAQLTLSGGLGKSNQSLGDIAGARFPYRSNMMRVVEAVSTAGGASISTVADTTIDDFNALWADKTFDDFNAVWAERTFSALGARPLLS